MSGEASNSQAANVIPSLQLNGQVHIERAENVHLGAGDVKQGQKVSTPETPKQKMNEVEEKVPEVSHTQEKILHV